MTPPITAPARAPAALALALAIAAGHAPAAPPDAFVAWDANEDGSLDPAELADGLGRLEAFSRWDANGDEGVDAFEFDRVPFREGDLFEQWDDDVDGRISVSEFHDGTLDKYDFDGDRQIGPREFSRLAADLRAAGLWQG